MINYSYTEAFGNKNVKSKNIRMKKTGFLCITIIAAFLSGNAQQKFDIGVQGGMNISSFYGKNKRTDQVFFPGFHLGASVQRSLTDVLALQSGIFYTRKGTKYESVFEQHEGGYAPDMGPMSTRYTFIEIPINAVYNFSGKMQRFYAGAGPYLAYLTGITNRAQGKKNKVDFADNDYNRRFDAGLSILAGYKLTEKLSAQAGLKNGFTRISKLKDAGVRGLYHRNIELSVRYRLFNTAP